MIDKADRPAGTWARATATSFCVWSNWWRAGASPTRSYQRPEACPGSFNAALAKTTAIQNKGLVQKRSRKGNRTVAPSFERSSKVITIPLAICPSAVPAMSASIAPGCLRSKPRITGIFGVTYTGGPTTPVPISETRQIDDQNLQFLAQPPRPIEPTWDDFTMDGKPMKAACHEYLAAAQTLRDEARRIAESVHGTNTLTPPPS